MAKTPTTTITLNEQAYTLLKRLKRPGESFSDVVIAHVHPPAMTAGELLDSLTELEGRPLVDQELMKQVKAGRKRRKLA